MNNTAFYETLGVTKDASEAEIKKAFRKLAMVHHPDKGGDPEMFTKIQAAYEILSNPEKKALYDQGGEEALDGGGMHDSDGMDIFDLFGGRGGGGRRRQTKPRGDDVNFPLQISLEELYKGCTKKLRLTRNVGCDECDGKGGKDFVTCTDCRGQGVRVMLRQVGPGMMSQSQVTCQKCSGVGQMCRPENVCKGCAGAKTKKEKKDIEVVVPRGSRNNHVITFAGEADQLPGTTPGDVKVTINVKEHPDFKPKGNHLFMKKKISLNDSLTGFSFTFKHLDGRMIHVNYDPSSCDTPLAPGQCLVIDDEGLPISGGIHSGSIYIDVDVTYPRREWFNGENIKALRHILPSPSSPVPCPPGAESFKPTVKALTTILNTITKEEESARRRAAEEEEDEGHSHGGGGQAACQQM